MAEIRLEVPDENQIMEILYDGTEIFQQPPSMSENLTQLARKIDFGMNDTEETGADEKEDTEEEKPYQQVHWPLENIRNKIKSSLTEMSVLHDLLQVTKEKRYMVLDPVQTPQPEPKLYLQFLSLKRSLSTAATTLLNGAESLRSSQTELSRGRQSSEFHIELLRLRQNWRLKKVGNAIIGDLSYKSAGSTFNHTGLFEVNKTDDEECSNSVQVIPGGVSPVSAVRQVTSSLKVQVSAELEGHAYIFVSIRKDEEVICSARIQGVSNAAKDVHWQQKLECAQNVLFCKELFNQLAREAVRLQPPIPHMVVGDQITSTILPGIHLVIGLSYSDSENKKKTSGLNGHGFSSNGTSTSTNTSTGFSKSSHDEVLEHSLHQLLHKSFQSLTGTSLPHPVYGHVCIPKVRRLAGPMGTHRDALLESMESECLLEQIIRQAQHNLLRLRTMFVIDQLSQEIKDPLIISHWNLSNSPTQSCVRINIVTQGYDSVLRTTLVIHVYEKTLKCICRDGKVMTLSFEPQELRDLMFIQISQHTISAVQCFARFMGWSVVSSENCIGVGSTEPLGNASAVVLASPNGNKAVAVRSGPKTGISVAVSSSPRNDFYPSDVVYDRRWEHLAGSWNEVRLDKMEGKNFLNKIELLLAALTAQT